MRPRPNRGGLSSQRGIRTSGPRILRRNDLRANLISKRSLPNRSKEYAKKIKQARLKLSESGSKRDKSDDEEENSSKDSDKEEKTEENDGDFLDIGNDVNLEEDDDENVAKSSTAAKDDDKDKSKKDDKEKSSPEKGKAKDSSTVDKDRSHEKSPSKEKDSKSTLIDLNCVHCSIKCLSVQVS